MGGFWKHVGLVFASIGKGALAAALWASNHPQVIDAVLSATNVPARVAQPIEEGVAVVGAVESGQK